MCSSVTSGSKPHTAATAETTDCSRANRRVSVNSERYCSFLSDSPQPTFFEHPCGNPVRAISKSPEGRENLYDPQNNLKGLGAFWLTPLHRVWLKILF
jgi:hypothetical protein